MQHTQNKNNLAAIRQAAIKGNKMIEQEYIMTSAETVKEAYQYGINARLAGFPRINQYHGKFKNAHEAWFAGYDNAKV